MSTHVSQKIWETYTVVTGRALPPGVADQLANAAVTAVGESVGAFCHPPVDPVTGEVSAEDDSILMGEMRHCDLPESRRLLTCMYPMWMHRWISNGTPRGVVICPNPKPLEASDFQHGSHRLFTCEHGIEIQGDFLCPEHQINVNVLNRGKTEGDLDAVNGE